MLVLSRSVNETIVIPELGISVEVTKVKGNTVRLGVSAPDSIRILRGELEPIVREFEDPSPQPPLASRLPVEFEVQAS